MELYDCDGHRLENSPRILYRGIDMIKDASDAIMLLDGLFEREGIPSKALMIKEGTFDFRKCYKEIRPEDLSAEVVERYMRMLDGPLEPKDINHRLMSQQICFFPTPFVSTSKKVMIAARYSHWIRRPILVFGTENLQGVDLSTHHADPDYEIAVFRELPMENLRQIIYFYEDAAELSNLLRKHRREDIRLVRGFTRPEFRYRDFSGDLVIDEKKTAGFKYRPEIIEFYAKLESRMHSEL